MFSKHRFSLLPSALDRPRNRRPSYREQLDLFVQCYATAAFRTVREAAGYPAAAAKECSRPAPIRE